MITGTELIKYIEENELENYEILVDRNECLSSILWIEDIEVDHLRKTITL